jgi:hypothetical protein
MGSDRSYGFNGAFDLRRLRAPLPLMAVCSDKAGWEHVSVSGQTACPTWEQMCRVKSLFWRPEEAVVQYHPAESEYVNLHPFCLHLWKPTNSLLPTPPAWMVGPMGGGL